MSKISSRDVHLSDKKNDKGESSKPVVNIQLDDNGVADVTAETSGLPMLQ